MLPVKIFRAGLLKSGPAPAVAMKLAMEIVSVGALQGPISVVWNIMGFEGEALRTLG
jgi:hypothetical protein